MILNAENIKKANEERTPEQWKAIAKKAGKASGEARRKKADLRTAAQAVIDGEYLDADGDNLSGAELLVLSLFKIAVDPKNKGAAVQSFNTIARILGQDVPDRNDDDDDLVREFLDALRG